MKFRGSAEFEWQEDSCGGLDLTLAGIMIGWVSHGTFYSGVGYDIWDRDAVNPLDHFQELESAKIAILKHFGIEVSE